jgi:hypothetical protein
MYLLTAIGLIPRGSSTVYISTQTVHRSTQLTTNWEECRPCPVFASYTLAFVLEMRKKHRKTSVRIEKNLSHGRKKPQSGLGKTSVRADCVYSQYCHMSSCNTPDSMAKKT